MPLRGHVGFESLESRRLFAIGLLSDAVGLSAASSIDIDGISYFFADDGVHGRELWKSDGTPLGTVLVKDLNPGANGTTLVSIAEADGHAVFLTIADQHVLDGMQAADFTVWSSDGTEGGTVVLAQYDDAFNLTIKQFGDRVAFAVSRFSALGVIDGSRLTDVDVYVTDGTPSGTTLLKTFAGSAQEPERVLHIPKMYAADGHVVFTPDEETLWSTDGTVAGTIDLTSAFGAMGLGSLSTANVVEVEGRVVIPRVTRHDILVTDGTLAGTASHPLDVSWIDPHSSFALGNAYYFFGSAAGAKTLWRLDLSTDETTAIFESQGDVSDNTLRAYPADGKVLIFTTGGDEVGSIWVAGPGADAVATKVADLPAHRWMLSPVVLDGSVYFGLVRRDEGAPEGDGAGFVGSRLTELGFGAGGGVGVGSDDYSVELWRSDGSAGGTSFVRELYDGTFLGNQVMFTLSAADGTLAVRTEAATGIQPGVPWSGNSLAPVSDETTVYGPEELGPGRSGASVKVVNGVLRLGGSTGADDFLLYRNPDASDELVVEYGDGYARVFAYDSIRRIIADLQDGDDRLEIVEHTPGEFRLWTSVLAGGGNDTIIGATGRDTILGGAGADFIRSRGNKDLVDGGAGRDRITGGEGDDLLSGGEGLDSVITGSGNDVLFGQNAVERAFGRIWDDGEDDDADRVLQSF